MLIDAVQTGHEYAHSRGGYATARRVLVVEIMKGALPYPTSPKRRHVLVRFLDDVPSGTRDGYPKGHERLVEAKHLIGTWESVADAVERNHAEQARRAEFDAEVVRLTVGRVRVIWHGTQRVSLQGTPEDMLALVKNEPWPERPPVVVRAPASRRAAS